MIIWV